MQWVRLVAAADYKDLDGWHVAEHATLLLYYMARVLAGVSGQRSVQSGRFLYVAIAGRGLKRMSRRNLPASLAAFVTTSTIPMLRSPWGRSDPG